MKQEKDGGSDPVPRQGQGQDHADEQARPLRMCTRTCISTMLKSRPAAKELIHLAVEDDSCEQTVDAEDTSHDGWDDGAPDAVAFQGSAPRCTRHGGARPGGRTRPGGRGLMGPCARASNSSTVPAGQTGLQRPRLRKPLRLKAPLGLEPKWLRLGVDASNDMAQYSFL